jgi:hypothetical protein
MTRPASDKILFLHELHKSTFTIIIIMTSSGSSTSSDLELESSPPPRDTQPLPKQSAPETALAKATWDDITSLLSDGEASFFGGTTLSDLTAKQVRTLCSKLGIKQVKNVPKAEMLLRLQQTYANRKAYAELGYVGQPPAEPRTNCGGDSTTASPRKEVQCSFRLVNILFSDAFADDFATLGNVASRQLLDAGAAGNDQHFWKTVQASFVSADDDPTFDELAYSDDDILGGQDHIDPSKKLNHDWKKLRAIWKSLNADYKAALTNYTVSGTHDQNFYHFCKGKVAVYYLWKKLQDRPQLNATVQACLPQECGVSSEDSTSIIVLGEPGFSRSTTSSSTMMHSSARNKKKRKDNNKTNEVALAIRDFSDSKRRSELAVHKLEFMSREEARRNKEVSLSEREGKMKEWDFVNANIRLFREAANGSVENSYNPGEDEDMEVLDGLMKRRRKLGKELGIL